MKLRYVGVTPTTFVTAGVGEVEPGEEFTVPEEFVEAFVGRDDVEEVEEDPEAAEAAEEKPKRRPRSEEPGQSVATDGGDPEKMSEENSGFVPDDH